jgi:hypothetical protein
VVRQIPILRKEHLTVYNKKSNSNSFQSILISSGSVPVSFKHLTPDNRIHSVGSRLRARVGSVGAGSRFHDLRRVLPEYF